MSREQNADTDACVFVRVLRARGMTVQDGDLKSAFTAIESYKLTATTRDPSCLCHVRCGGLEGTTEICEEASSPQWNMLFMFPLDNVSQARRAPFPPPPPPQKVSPPPDPLFF